MTVKQLLKLCEEQVKKGNWGKHIYISDDDEWNGYHELIFCFTDEENDIKENLAVSNTLIEDINYPIENLIILW